MLPSFVLHPSFLLNHSGSPGCWLFHATQPLHVLVPQSSLHFSIEWSCTLHVPDHALITCLNMHWSRSWSYTDHVTVHALITWLNMQCHLAEHALITWLLRSLAQTLIPSLSPVLFHLTNIYWKPTAPVTRQLRPHCPRVWDQALEADLLIKQSVLSYIPGECWVRGSSLLQLPSSWSFPPQLGRLGIRLYFTLSMVPSSLWPTLSSSFSHSIVPWTKTAVHTSVRKLIFCFWSLSKHESIFFKKSSLEWSSN